MANDSVANDSLSGPYLGDTVVDSWKDTGLPRRVTHELADITRAVYGIRELTRLLAEDDFGREQLEDGVDYVPMSAQRRWALNHAIKQLLFDAELRLEHLPVSLRDVVEKSCRGEA